jgi:uncharacterized protein (DUF1697 family)
MAAETVYIVLFRGVGGATQLPTKPLAAALTEAGFKRVQTYINSGNVVLASGLPAKKVLAEVARIVERDFGFTKHIMAATREEWSRLIAANPFPEGAGKELHGFLLEKAPDPDAVKALEERTTGRERIAYRDGFLYFHAPEGFGISKLPPLIDRTLGVATTARNWNTVLKLAEIADH